MARAPKADETLQEKEAQVDREVTERAQEVAEEQPELTPFEAGQVARFEDQNELEARIDAAGADMAPFDKAGNPTVVDAEELLLGVGTQTTTYPGLVPNPYPPTNYGTNAIVTSGGIGSNASDLVSDPTLVTRGYVAGDAMPPENNVYDIRETDNVNDTKDFMRRYRPVNDVIVAANRNKYPTQIGGFPAVEPPA
jgi:hypothetical protein